MLDLFVTDVEKNSAKVFTIAGLLAVMQSLGYSTGVYKPICVGAVENSGFLQSSDLAFVKFIDPFIKTYFSYLLKEKSAPLLAAAAEGIVIEKNLILKDYQAIQDKNEVLIVDGTLGLATPLSKDFLEEDLVKMLDLPVLFCVSAKNNSINNVLLSLNRVKNIRGVILNDYPENTDDINIKLMPKLIEEYSDAKVLGMLPQFDKNINPNDLINVVLNNVDLESVFNVQIAKLKGF